MTPTPTLGYTLVIILPLLATAVALWLGGRWRQAFVLGARLLLGVLMLGGGLYKLSDNHLRGIMGPPIDHVFLTKYGLEIFAQFIGVAQLLTGLLLLTHRFALLGAVLLVPMWLNIIFLTWSQHWVGTPFLVSGFLVLNLGLLLHDYQRLKLLLYPPAQLAALQTLPLQAGPVPTEALWWLGVAVVVAGSLLYPVSFLLMKATMLSGLLLLAAAGWRLRKARQGSAQSSQPGA